VLQAEDIVPFGPTDAVRAAELFRQLSRPRGRELDLAIAACGSDTGPACGPSTAPTSKTYRA
jgi:hypothetical protein